MTSLTTNKRAFSLQGKLVFAALLLFAASLTVALLLFKQTASLVLSVTASGICATLLFFVFVRRLLHPVTSRIDALIDSADSLRDADFSFTIAESRNDELGDLVHAYNQMVAVLRDERQNLHQRELMLDTVLQASPLALVLCNDGDHVIYANSAARNLYASGRRFAGRRFLGDVISNQPDTMREALVEGQNAMISVDEDGRSERYHLSCNEFVLNSRGHRLYLLKRLTQELNRQEVATWKKVIRLIGHELNNSLAPISSLAHSGRLLLEKQRTDQLAGVLSTIGERSEHLKSFIEGYAKFAKLPDPQRERVCWSPFLTRLQHLQAFVFEPVAEDQCGWFDPSQMEQVIINLCKNALESGSAPEQIVLTVKRDADGWLVVVADAGKGMSDEGLTNALLPFYSTKKSGSGLGLSLCREIVDAHDGRIGIKNRAQGGVAVSIWLPQPPFCRKRAVPSAA